MTVPPTEVVTNRPVSFDQSSSRRGRSDGDSEIGTECETELVAQFSVGAKFIGALESVNSRHGLLAGKHSQAIHKKSS